MVKFDGKDNANTLLNIDNFFGSTDGPIKPMLMFLVGATVPMLLWVFVLISFIPFKFFIVPWLLFTARWALITLGKEKEKMADFQQQRKDEYKAMNELVHINNIYPDGLIEYSNGVVAYIITGFPKCYLNDKKFSVDLEQFMNELDIWNWDYYLHNAIDEVICEDQLPKLSRYKDEDVIQDRINFFEYQDAYARTNTGLYRYSFLVYGGKADWKKIRAHLESLVESEVANCFNELAICDRDMVGMVMNRDVCSYVDFVKMLTDKYETTDFKGSKVLWYDDKIPKKYRPKDKNVVGTLTERRVTGSDE